MSEQEWRKVRGPIKEFWLDEWAILDGNDQIICKSSKEETIDVILRDHELAGEAGSLERLKQLEVDSRKRGAAEAERDKLKQQQIRTQEWLDRFQGYAANQAIKLKGVEETCAEWKALAVEAQVAREMPPYWRDRYNALNKEVESK